MMYSLARWRESVGNEEGALSILLDLSLLELTSSRRYCLLNDTNGSVMRETAFHVRNFCFFEKSSFFCIMAAVKL